MSLKKKPSIENNDCVQPSTSQIQTQFVPDSGSEYSDTFQPITQALDTLLDSDFVLEDPGTWNRKDEVQVGLLIGAGHGLLHSNQIDIESSTLDCVPVDYLANCIIAAAWQTANHSSGEPKNTTVYNFTLTSIMSMPWKRYVNFALQNKKNWPFSRAIWYTSFICIDNYILSELAFHALHTIPGAIMDKLIWLFGGKPRLQKLYARIGSLKGSLAFFIYYLCEFRNENVMTLWNGIDKEDKKLFCFDLRDYNFEEHFLVSKLGARYYYLKEDMDNIPAAEVKNTRLYRVHVVFKVVCGFIALKLLVFTARALPF